ncbi:hypothetical protein [Magnetofaba australis]|uniref:hypothetical protein n=1 Tax=Magnetofaba australis TaxID=1472297 RepID=UPI000A19F4FA|nr:hypothetical protein [Magnetofaba australis]
MSSGWGCPHEVAGGCAKVAGRPCDPGMKGCVLFGRFTFSNPEKNQHQRRAKRDANGRRIPAEGDER